MERKILHVAGMDCRGCGERVERALARIDGVVGVAADHSRGTVEVALDPARTSEGIVRRSLERCGHRVTS